MTVPRPPAPQPAGIGIDLLEIGRLERALERRPQLAERLFTDGELAYARSRHRPGRHLAARFAAKEAAVKALGGPAVPPRDSSSKVATTPLPDSTTQPSDKEPVPYKDGMYSGYGKSRHGDIEARDLSSFGVEKEDAGLAHRDADDVGAPRRTDDGIRRLWVRDQNIPDIARQIDHDRLAKAEWYES